MVKLRSEEALTEGGGSYLAIEKAMKKKKNRKIPPPEEEISNMVASNVDPSLLVRVPHDNRGAGGDRTQVVSKSLPLPPVTRSQVEGGSIGVGLDAPQPVDAVQMAPHNGKDFVGNSRTGDVIIDVGGGKTQTVPAFHPLAGSRGSSTDGLHNAPFAGKSLVFQAIGSGSGSVTKDAGRNVKGPKLAGAMLQRVRKALSRRSGARLGAGSASKRPIPPTPLHIRPEAAIPGAVLVGPPVGAKVRPKFSEVIKDNRIVGNGLKLEHYDPMDNEDDVVLDESDEIPFVETWGYCLIG
ncbi:hypothetical protein LIER_31558 [Lithospermum erythrorhizon]|uniref:Uncharacterized protein n=1 Tax=Lithospermum erythrorhizon TaxID=34254 RepID=A0AAV3RTT0_LITER